MNVFMIKVLAGWGLVVAPGALAALVLGSGRWRLDGLPEALLTWIGSSATLGLLGSLMGAWAGASAPRGDRVFAGALAGLWLPGILALVLVFGAFLTSDPFGWIAVVAAFTLPGPIAGGATAWLHERLRHGTS